MLHALLGMVREDPIVGPPGPGQHTGLPIVAEALIIGLASAASLPIGAACGILFSPVPDYVVAGFVAFGAGALLFAVTVEMYAHHLEKMKTHPETGTREVAFSCVCCVLGALLYIALNRKMREIQESSIEKAAEEQIVDIVDSDAGTPTDPPTPPRIQRRKTRALLTLMSGEFTNEEEMAKAIAERQRAQSLGLAMFLGLFMDSIPESVLIGLMVAERDCSVVFIVSIFIANFPEAFSAASIARKPPGPGEPDLRTSVLGVLAMWTGLFLWTGLLCMVTVMIIPPGTDLGYAGACAEGLAGGAMMAMVAACMLPEAYHQNGDIIGVIAVCGFLTSVMLKAAEAYYDYEESKASEEAAAMLMRLSGALVAVQKGHFLRH
mmetsp:Transcript_91417/g.244786  ORF Transcript_91417/g.244786 Transcript_91417/m.244786 type:complete len:378 (+) Transcript_91417:111-1244(+)